MKHTFLNDPAEVAWLRSTHLRDVAIPPPWHTFKSFVLIGNEDAPDSVALYLSNDPLYRDKYFVVDFITPADSGVYGKGQP